MSDNIIISKQDASQVLRLAYDDDAKALRTVGSSAAETTVVQPDGSLLHVTVDASALPTGAATEATLSELNAKTGSSAVTVAFDEQVISYVGVTTDVDTITYKLAGMAVATTTFSYDGNGRISNILTTTP